MRSSKHVQPLADCLFRVLEHVVHGLVGHRSNVVAVDDIPQHELVCWDGEGGEGEAEE